MENIIGNMSVNKELFGERLKSLLDENNSTIYLVSEFTHLSAPTISRYINGTMAPKITTVESIARYFKINPVWLMGYDVSKNLENSTFENESIVLNGNAISISVHQKNLINKYDALDDYGKNNVDTLLDNEYKRCTDTTVATAAFGGNGVEFDTLTPEEVQKANEVYARLIKEIKGTK